MRELAAIQRAFYQLVTTGQDAPDSDLLGATRHLDVYANMYVDRLHDVLVDDYPKLHAVLGRDVFRDLARQFIRARPPTSFTVRDFGIALAEYLVTRQDMPTWSADLAALERARVDVFDGCDATALTRAALAAVPVDSFPEFTLRLVPSSTLVPLRWTIDDVWSAVEEGVVHDLPEPCERTVVVWRSGVRVLHRTLDDDEARLMPLVARSESVANVSTRLAELGCSAPEQRMVELLTRWLDAELLA